MLITKQDELTAFMNEAITHPFLTVDTEFLREKTYYPKLCLIQVGMPDGKAAAIDPLSDDIDLAPVLEMLRNKDILKIFHAARQDLEIFYRLMGEVPAPFFDTQIAAMVCGYGDQVGYENLVIKLTNGTLDKTVQFTNWAQRPLTQKQIDYAIGDVTHLVQVYEKLIADLDARGRTKWVYEEKDVLANPEIYESRPEDAWKRVKVKSAQPKVLAVLKELAAWRENRAQTKDIPRGWVMRDETLADMAAQAPSSVGHLKKIRNMPQDIAKGSGGEALLKIIAKVLASDPKDWPRKAKRKNLPSEAAATVDILKMLLKVTASSYEVASRIIASVDDLEDIAVSGENTDSRILKGWRLEVFGRDALALIKGDLSVGFTDGKIAKYQITDDTKLYGDAS